eukprot:g37774.t1
MSFRSEVLLVEVHNHVQQYERKLLSLEERRKQNQTAAQIALGKGAVSTFRRGGVPYHSESQHFQERRGTLYPSGSWHLQERRGTQYPSESQHLQERRRTLYPSESQHLQERRGTPLPSKSQHLQEWSKVQARLAFSAYLQRVQFRLLKERLRQNEPTTLTDQEEKQMDLVVRFLKRAASNLQQSVMVTLPSRRLPISERRHILAQQLGVFIRSYSK